MCVFRCMCICIKSRTSSAALSAATAPLTAPYVESGRLFMSAAATLFQGGKRG